MILGVSYDTPAENRAWRDDMGFDFRLLSDLDQAMAAAYGAVRPPGDRFAQWPRRLTYVIDPGGVVRLTYVVAGSQIPRHATRVLEDVLALEGG